ncbi:hypothetical protein PG997_005983 [Apiospora hydei]|uniref:Uncharacterized protein n=1 Tax=Apiospora hydei TaxID=1337664 RepID=A0ABR1WNU2_9PEZI
MKMELLLFSVAVLYASVHADCLSLPTPTKPPQSDLGGELPLTQDKDVPPMPGITAPPSVPELQVYTAHPDDEGAPEETPSGCELPDRSRDDELHRPVSVAQSIYGPKLFIGETATCQSGATFAVRGGYGACCHPTAADCQFPTGCAGQNVVGPNGMNGACSAGWTCQDAVVLQSRGSPDRNTYIMCKSGAYSQLETWYRNRFAFPQTTTAVVVVDPTSVIVHSVTSTRKRTTTTNGQSVATDEALPPPDPLRDPFKNSASRQGGQLGLQGLIAIVANILYVWA